MKVNSPMNEDSGVILLINPFYEILSATVWPVCLMDFLKQNHGRIHNEICKISLAYKLLADSSM